MAAGSPNSRYVEHRALSIRLPQPLWIGAAAFGLVAAAAVLSVILPAYARRETIQFVESVGGTARRQEGGPDWLRKYAGNERMTFFDNADFVSLYGSSIDDHQISRLGGLPDLRKLVLLGTSIGDPGLRRVEQLTNLRYVDLEGTKVTNDGLRSLARLGNLESLDLSKTDIDDNGLLQLKPLIRLKELRVYETRVTNRGVSTLKQALPELQVWTSANEEQEQVSDAPSTEPARQFQLEGPTSDPTARASTPRKWSRAGRKAGIGWEQKINICLHEQRVVVEHHQQVHLETRGDSGEEIINQVVASIDSVADSWGEPPANFYWVPVVQFIVCPGGDANYSQLHSALEQRWGITSKVEYVANHKDRAQ